MATIKKTLKKAQTGKDVPKGYVRGEMSEGKLYKKADADKWGKGMADAMDKQAGLGKYAPKPKGMNFDKKSFDKLPKIKPKAKSGGSFPDLNKDGKVTKADILKGRGVIAKKGASVKKCKYGCK
jgi:hypothetical protein